MNKKHLISIILSLIILSLFLIPYFNVSAKVTCNPNTLKPVKYGQKSLAVKNLQACLIEAGYNIPTGANGYYGVQTKKAVKKFYSEWYGNWSGNSIGQKGISKLKEKLLSKKQNLNSENCWAKAYRVIDKNEAYSISQTKDGGYILAGLMSPGKGADILVIKLDSDSNIQWAKTYREDSYDYGSYNAAYSISQTSDGGYILIGETNSLGTGSDILVIKLTSDGDIQWAKIYGGENFDSASLISPTQDGGYILIGTTNSFGAEGDILVIKLFFNGNIQWAKTYRAGDYDKVYSISRTKDGGYILAGYTNFLNTEKDNILVIKLDSDSNIQWAKTYGGSGDDWAHSIFQTQDGGYMLVGWTNSFDIAGALVIKLDSSGNIQWAKIYEGGNYNSAFLISPTKDGGYILASDTNSLSALTAEEYDILVIKLTSNGNIQWAKIYGGRDLDHISSISQTLDGGYVLAGWTGSFATETDDFYTQTIDALVMKLDSNGNIGFTGGLLAMQNVNPAKLSPTLKTFNIKSNVRVNNISPSFFDISSSLSASTINLSKLTVISCANSCTRGLTVPSVPRNLKATSGDQKITLNWDSPLDDGGSAIQYYKIYRGGTYIASTTNLTYTDTGLTNGIRYCYYVRAVNSVGESPRSNIICPTVGLRKTPPFPPQNLRPIPGDAQITLTWEASVSNGGSTLLGYKIYRGLIHLESKTNITYVDIGTYITSTTNLTYTDTGLTNGKEYCYYVTAYNEVGESDKEGPVCAVPLP